jgi:hypothetical protein
VGSTQVRGQEKEGGMEVDQKHITTVRMHDAKGSDVVVVKEGSDYHLQLVSSNNMVNITLGGQDLRKLCQQLVQLDIEENWKTHFVPPPEVKSFFLNGSPRPYQETVANWFMRMAGEMNDHAAKR